jgi:plastocyanin
MEKMVYPMTRWIFCTALAATVFMALATTLFAGVAVSPAGAAETAVKISNFTFGPRQVTVPAGTTVVWTNEDDIPHTVTSTTRAFSSPPLDTDQTFSFTFTTPGTYGYFCALHPHMTGTIVVTASTGSNMPP